MEEKCHEPMMALPQYGGGGGQAGVWEVSEFCPTLKVIPGSPMAFHRRWTSELPQVALTHQCASVCVSPTAKVCIESAADSQECVKVCACMCDRVLEAQRVYETMLLVSYGEQCGAVKAFLHVYLNTHF